MTSKIDAQDDLDAYDWIYGLWFCGNGKDADWLARVVKYKDRPELHYRFRYYASEDPGNDAWSDKDKKNWYRVKPNLSSGEEPEVTIRRLVDATNAIAQALEIKMQSKHDFVLLECGMDDPKILFEIGSRPWAHLKRVRAARQSEL